MDYEVIYKVGKHGNITKELFTIEKFEKFLDRYTIESNKVTILSFEKINKQMRLEI